MIITLDYLVSYQMAFMILCSDREENYLVLAEFGMDYRQLREWNFFACDISAYWMQIFE